VTRPLRLSTAVFLVAALIAVGGVLYLTLSGGTERVYLAARDLPAYHQLTQADVRTAEVPRGEVPADAVRDRDALLGRYTLLAAQQDRPYQGSQLGPKLPDGALDRPLVAVKAVAETTMGGRLSRGDRVDVVLPPSQNGPAAVRLADVLVVDTVGGPDAALILGINPAQENELPAVRGAVGPVIVRTHPYAGP
jgi:Flp pilus assembly protein CpaB